MQTAQDVLNCDPTIARQAVDVSGAAAKGVASAQEFLDLGSNVGVLYYNELPMTAGKAIDRGERRSI